jgi:hypothetical protein
MRTTFAAAFACACLLLTSCLDLESRIQVASDGSGTIALSYSVNKALLNMGTIDDNNKFIAIPISKEDFKRSAEGIDGLTLKSYSIEETEESAQVDAVFKFKDIDALSALFGGAESEAVRIAERGGQTIFRHVLFDGIVSSGNSDVVLDEDSREMIETFFGTNEMTFFVNTPKTIQSVSRGSFDGKTATIVFPLAEVVAADDPIVWEIRW